MKKPTIVFWGFTVFAALTSMAATIKGLIVDSDNLELPGVFAQLIHYPDSTRVAANVTDIDGTVTFQNLPPADYYLQFTMAGMDIVAKNISIKDTTDTIDLGRIMMTENAVMLDEAVVTAVRAAVVAKQDTLEFNAGSFHTNPNATVEDLLKRLPGVEVGTDGSISSGGKSVTKILVNGKEFFADDPKLATKNLTSDMVDKVQVIDRKSEQARLTGVDDGEDETVINLTLKKNMDNGWFGTVSGGYGTDRRYQANLNLNYFRDGNQVTIIGGANNINEMGFSDQGRGRFRDFGGNNGINSTQQFGINFNVGNEEKFRVGGNVLYAHTDRDARNRFDTQYLFPDSVSYLTGGSKTRDQGHSIRAQFRMQWNITDNDVLDFRPEFTYNNRRSEMQDSSILRSSMKLDDRVNSSFAMRSNRGEDYNASGRLIYTHRFSGRPGRSISATFNYKFSDTYQKSTSWNDIEYYLRQDDSELLYQFLDNRQWSNYIEGRLTWTEPIGNPSSGNYMEIAYLASLRYNNADKLTYDIPDNGFDPFVSGLPNFNYPPSDTEYVDSLSNRFRNKFTNQELQVGFKRSTGLYNLNVGLTFSPSSSESEDLINPLRNIDTRWVYNVAPYLRFRYKFSKQRSLMINYRARTSQPSLTQLQPVPDTSDPLNITVGNPDLKPTFTQTLNARFSNFNSDTQQSFSAMANASFALNTIVARTVTDSQTGVRTTTYANANGNWNVFGMLMLNQPLRNKSWRFSARLNTRYSSSAGYINGDFNRSGNFSVSPTAGMTFTSDIFQMTLTPTYSFQMATSTLKMQKDRYTHAYGFNTDASLYLPFGLEVGTDLAFSRNTGFARGFDNTQWLWNAQISYSILHDKSLTFSVRAYDMLGMKKNITRTVSANQITDNEYNDLSRYVMFGVSWKFNTFSKKTSKVNMPDDLPPDAPPMERGTRGEGVPQGPPPGGFGGPGRPPGL